LDALCHCGHNGLGKWRTVEDSPFCRWKIAPTRLYLLLLLRDALVRAEQVRAILVPQTEQSTKALLHTDSYGGRTDEKGPIRHFDHRSCSTESANGQRLQLVRLPWADRRHLFTRLILLRCQSEQRSYRLRLRDPARIVHRRLEGNRHQKARSEAADAFAANVRPIIKEIQASGVSSLRGVARALTARGVRTARGGDWTAVQVSDILRR